MATPSVKVERRKEMKSEKTAEEGRKVIRITRKNNKTKKQRKSCTKGRLGRRGRSTKTKGSETRRCEGEDVWGVGVKGDEPAQEQQC